MDFKVIKIEQKVVTKPGRNQNSVYAQLTLEDSEDGELRSVPVFDAEAKKYLSYIGKEAELPDKDKVWQYCFDMPFTFPGGKEMVRVNDNGQPELNKFGQMYTRCEVTVLCRYKYDEQRRLLDPNASPLAPRKGWDPVSRGTSVMNAFYVPLASVQTPGGPGPETPAPGAPAPANIPV